MKVLEKIQRWRRTNVLHSKKNLPSSTDAFIFAKFVKKNSFNAVYLRYFAIFSRSSSLEQTETPITQRNLVPCLVEISGIVLEEMFWMHFALLPFGDRFTLFLNVLWISTNPSSLQQIVLYTSFCNKTIPRTYKSLFKVAVCWFLLSSVNRYMDI